MRKPIHIILTDDDPDDCFIFSSISREVSEKITTTCLGDCHGLLKYLEYHKAPDIIFLDLNMPIFTGWDCLKQIKSNPNWKDIPVVIYSTAARKETIDNCYREGASLYIVKPNESELLKKAITSAIDELL